MFMSQPMVSDPRLLKRLQDAAKRGVTAAEMHAQRVSFIVSSVSDEKTKVTREMVEAELNKLNGAHS